MFGKLTSFLGPYVDIVSTKVKSLEQKRYNIMDRQLNKTSTWFLNVVSVYLV